MPSNSLLDDVKSRFAVLARLSQDDLDSFSFLCDDALSAVLNERRSPSEVPQDDEAPLLCNAAAALAFYHFALLSAALPDEDFSAGDVRVSHPKPDLAAAKKIFQDARAMAAPLLLDSDFLFRAFRGDSA